MKPWPEDVVLITASVIAEARVPPGAAVLHPECRDCGAMLSASPFTRQAALANPLRNGRPVDYICFGCASNYDASDALMIDHRPKENRI